MKSVLLSIKPKYCELIASGKKTVEIRKNRPKIDVPFKCYIYETKGKKENSIKFPAPWEDDELINFLEYEGGGKVIGEFICDRIEVIDVIEMYGSFFHIHEADMCLNEKSCLSNDEIDMYLQDKQGYAWHISELVIYDKPKDLDEFEKPCLHDCRNCKYWYSGSPIDYEPPCCEWEDCVITRPPQSWCYVEELEVSE